MCGAYKGVGNANLCWIRVNRQLSNYGPDKLQLDMTGMKNFIKK